MNEGTVGHPEPAANRSRPDAIDYLLEHHARIRAQLEALQAIEDDLKSRDSDALLNAARLAEEVIAVFGNEGQVHALDESETLFPCLRGRLGPGDAELVEALDSLEAEHLAPSCNWPSLQRWLWMLTVPDELIRIRDFQDARRALEEHFRPHLEREEALVFPAARRLLDAATLAQLADEMRLRSEHAPPGGRPLVP